LEDRMDSVSWSLEKGKKITPNWLFSRSRSIGALQ
jgi:hypothetical protein